MNTIMDSTNIAVTPNQGLSMSSNPDPMDHLLSLVDSTGRIASFFQQLGLENLDDLEYIATSQELNSYLEKPFKHNDGMNSLSIVEVQKILRLFNLIADMDEVSPTAILEIKPQTLKSSRRRVHASALSQHSPPSQVSVSSQSSDSSMSAKAFCSSIKKSFADYSELTNDNTFLHWHSSFLGLVTLHEFYDILDPTSIIDDVNDSEYKAKCEFAFTVFRKTLKSPRTITLVTQHNQTRDARALYADLLMEFSKENPHAEISIKKLKNSLSKTLLDDSWTRSNAAFFSTFTRRIATLEELTETPVSEDQKFEWLKDAIRVNSAFNSAYISHKAAARAENKSVNYATVFHLLSDLAVDFDEASPKLSKKQAKAARKAQQAQQQTQQQASQTQGSNSNRPKSELWIDPSKWAKMSSEARKAHLEKVKQAKAKRAANRQGNSSTSTPTSAVPTPPVTPGPAATSVQATPPAAAERPPGDLLNNLISSSRASRQPPDLVINGQAFRSANHAHRIYRAGARLDQNQPGSLVDGGCNGGLAGSDDVLLIDQTFDTVTVEGIAGTGFDSVPLGTVAGLIPTTSGPIIGYFFQYALCNRGTTIHSPNQLRSFGNIVDDCPKRFGGGQVLRTHDGYEIPLNIRGSLPYMDMRKPTSADIARYPHVHFTADSHWEPASLDQDAFYDPLESDDYDAYPEICYQDPHDGEIFANPAKSVTRQQPNFEALRPYFNWISIDRIMQTLKNTTQFYRAAVQNRLKRHYKTRFPAANISRLNEDVATDTFFSDTPAHDDGIPGHGGCTMVQVYTGIKSHVTAAFPMKSESQIPSTLQEFLRKFGAPNKLKSDNAKAIYGDATQEILRQYHIGSMYSEPEQQNQNPVERKIQDIKSDTSKCMDRTGTPETFWLLCLLYIVFLHNHLSYQSLDGKTPLQVATGIVPDISYFLSYHWWQPVYYLDDDGGFPSQSKEKRGRWVGVAENIGDTLTYYVLTDDTQQVIARSVLRPVTNNDQNLRADNPSPKDGEEIDVDDSDIDNSPCNNSPTFHLKSFTRDFGSNQSPMILPKFSPEELLQRTFVYPTSNGQKVRTEIIKKIHDADADNHQNIKFLCKVGDDGAEEIMSYTEICHLIEEQDLAEASSQFHTFKRVLDHHGPLKSQDAAYNKCLYNVKILWEDDTETWEPLNVIMKDDPITLVSYALENDLLDQPIWKKLRKYTKNNKKYQRLVKQSIMKGERR